MKWLPFHKVELKSALAPDVALDALRAHLEPAKPFRLRFPNPANGARFEGEVIAPRFVIWRVIGYRNAFLPIVEGEVSADAEGALVRIVMFPHVLVLAFLLLWFLVAASVVAAALVAQSALSTVPAALVLTGLAYALVLGGFWFEAGKQERALREIFQARE